jgi:hypothetical protein
MYCERGKKRNLYRLLVENPEGKRPLGRPRWKCVNIIKVDLAEAGLGGVDWICMVQDRDKWRSLVDVVMNLHL